MLNSYTNNSCSNFESYNSYPSFFSISNRQNKVTRSQKITKQQKTAKSRNKIETRPVVPEVSSNLNCALRVSKPSYSSIEDNESFDFLNVLFIAKLRNMLQQSYKKVNIIQDISSLQTKQFKAKVNNTEITVQKNGIFFVAKSEAELKKAMMDVALMIYRNYPGVNLYAICADKAKQKVLQQVLDEAYMAVENEKSPVCPAISFVKQDNEPVFQPSAPSYSEIFNNNYLPGFEPSAPPAEDALAQQNAPLDDFLIPFNRFANQPHAASAA